MAKNALSTMPRQMASGAHRTEVEETLASVKSRRATLDTERRAIEYEDNDLSFLQELLEGDLKTIEGHLLELGK